MDYLKLVVVVDEDVDVFDESAVLWALATRVQADRDLVAISGAPGAILDPSATERSITAKLGIDATRPCGQSFAEKLSMTPGQEARARQLVDRLLAEPVRRTSRPRAACSVGWRDIKGATCDLRHPTASSYLRILRTSPGAAARIGAPA
jgi:hypothetical protein